jgi:hypothetical protein
MTGPNRTAAELVVAGLRAANAVVDRDEALLAAFLTCASDLDASAGDPSLHREYRGYLAVVREVGTGGVDDDTAEFLASVRTPLGDAANSKPVNVRPSNHQRGRPPRSAVDAVAGAGRPGRGGD